MSSQTFYASSAHSRRIQPAPRCRAKVQLSKEARALLTASRRKKSQLFKTVLDDVWTNIDESIKTIASSNCKSIRRVQQDLHMGQGLLWTKHAKLSMWNVFCWKKNQTADEENGLSGKAVLQDLVQENHAEYHELNDDAKASILKEYEEFKATKTTGTHISTKSKVNDVTQTLKAVENELNSLRSRTGTETILYTTCGSTDLPLRGVAFATHGIENFMESIMNVDNQDLVGKKEGFAMSGICGAAQNHQKCCSKIRGSIRNLINGELQNITGDPDAKMQWVHYWRNIVQRYLVVCTGWPDKIPFENLSKVSSSLADLEMLERKWKSGKIHWRRLENEKFEQLHRERNEKLDSGAIIEHCHRTHSDKGKKCTRTRSPDENNENADNDDSASHTSPVPPASASAGSSTRTEPLASTPASGNGLSPNPVGDSTSCTSPAPLASASAGSSTQIDPLASAPTGGNGPSPNPVGDMSLDFDPNLFDPTLFDPTAFDTVQWTLR
ncbi:uncharacterized protein EDB91DRAFT_1061285 [Suillus paluster]|uniref:uncharacterized protein n=1 Tax=Suillus paluster TaxID=48578 RepID=UPI001B86B692|nr:uncharacterized protein EDB91DRAFT_1061285 [Suillus paluster]KAG1727171.1 hypothetical protein EDB91DRAFT_1061285 [Suillus paluster]